MDLVSKMKETMIWTDIHGLWELSGKDSIQHFSKVKVLFSLLGYRILMDLSNKSPWAVYFCSAVQF